MPTKLCREANPFESPTKARVSSAPMTTSPDILTTADLLLEQLKDLENLCSTVEERVQRKRRALKELEYLIFGSNSAEGSPPTPVCPANTPIGPRSHPVSPRLRGLFDMRGPGQANIDAIQSCLDYSPDTQKVDVPTHEDLWRSEEWVDDDDDDNDEVLLSDSPFDDKYALRQTPRKVEKELPAIPREGAGEGLESRIPRKVYVRREVSASRRLTGRPQSAMARSASHRGRASVGNVKVANAGPDVPTKGTTRRGSRKRSVLENPKTKGTCKGPSGNENESGKDRTRRKEKRKGLWTIYSVCTEFGLSGTPRAI